MNNKQAYRQWAANNVLPLFHQPAWLDIVSPEWDVALAYSGDQICGLLPYCITKKPAGKQVYMPMLTPYLGPVLLYPPNQKLPKRNSFEKKVLGELIDQLPEAAGYQIKCQPQFQNGLPFYWAEFNLGTRYTYVLTDTTDTDKLFKGFRENVRREIKKAQKELIITTNNDISSLYELKRSSYKAKGNSMPVSLDYVKAIGQLVHSKNWGVLYEAHDQKGNLHAAVLLVWDTQNLYYLLGAADPDYKTSGAMSFLMWQGILLASEKGLAFNFEGSMIPEIARFFSAFGGALSPYLELTKTKSNLLKLKNLIT